MIRLLKDRYVVAYLLAYVVCIILAVRRGIVVNELLVTAIFIGIGFTSFAYFLTRSADSLFDDRSNLKNEIYIVIALILYGVCFITYYHQWPVLCNLISSENEWVTDLSTGVAKLIFLVGIPILVYHFVFDFHLRDWGLGLKMKRYVSKHSLVVFIVMALVICGFQYFLGSGAQPLREGLYSVHQLALGSLFSLLWLILTVGIVEEFFFRVFLQSRLTVILKSPLGGIILSAVLFGLAHAPGMYLRGGGVLANLGPDPGLMMSVVYSFLVLSVAGFFLSVIWLKTKNFWLIVAIHAMVDLLPNLSDFIELWGL